jgi:hypothetical protein
VGEDEDGTRRNISGGKTNTQGTPQGGVISPLLANLHLSKTEKEIFTLSEAVCFFDLTNTHFGGQVLGNPKAKFGRSTYCCKPGQGGISACRYKKHDGDSARG